MSHCPKMEEFQQPRYRVLGIGRRIAAASAVMQTPDSHGELGAEENYKIKKIANPFEH